MNNARVTVFMVISVALLGFGPSANTQTPKDAQPDEAKPGPSHLQSKVEKLEDQMIALKKQLSEKHTEIMELNLKFLDLAKKVNDMEQRRLIDAMEQRPKVPSNWVPKTFNGVQYYIVPCDENPRN